MKTEELAKIAIETGLKDDDIGPAIERYALSNMRLIHKYWIDVAIENAHIKMEGTTHEKLSSLQGEVKALRTVKGILDKDLKN